MSQYPPNQPPQPEQYPQQPMQEQPYPQFPFQPSQEPYALPPRKRRTGLWITLAVVLVAVVASCAIISAAVSNDAKTATQATTNTSSTSTSSSSSTANHEVGNVVSIDSIWQVTITSTKTDPGDGDFNVPKPGNTYILIDVTEKNISGSQQNASGLVQFTLRGTDGTSYDESLTYSNDPGGTVSAGQPLKGVLAYEVPKGVKQFTLNFQSNLTSDQTTWDIKV